MVRGLVVAGLVLLVAGAMVLLSGASPLTAADTVEPFGDVEAAFIEDFGDRGSLVLRYSHGHEAAFVMTLVNDAPVGLTVTGIEIPHDDERLLFQPTAVRLPEDDGDGDALEEFDPFVLGPGEQRRVVIEGRFEYCRYYTERSVEIHDSLTVRYRVAGLPSSQQVELPADVIVRSPTIQNCPDRVMDRSARQRRDGADEG